MNYFLVQKCNIIGLKKEEDYNIVILLENIHIPFPYFKLHVFEFYQIVSIFFKENFENIKLIFSFFPFFEFSFLENENRK